MTAPAGAWDHPNGAAVPPYRWAQPAAAGSPWAPLAYHPEFHRPDGTPLTDPEWALPAQGRHRGRYVGPSPARPGQPAGAPGVSRRTPPSSGRPPAGARGAQAGRRVRQSPSGAPVGRVARHAAMEDARLLRALLPLLSLPSVYPRVAFLVLGFAAITSLGAAYAELLPLPVGTTFVLFPAIAGILLLSLRHPTWGRRALVGFVAGIVATGIYDILRISLVLIGLWGDPIPGIGRLALNNPDASPVWGYLWRFIGNGGGMGLAFAMLPWRGVRSGIAYGTMICLGLLAVLAFAPNAQQHFFPLTPVTATGAMAGHWVYGAVLGWMSAVQLPPVRLECLRRAAARRALGPTGRAGPSRRAPVQHHPGAAAAARDRQPAARAAHPRGW